MKKSRRRYLRKLKRQMKELERLKVQNDQLLRIRERTEEAVILSRKVIEEMDRTLRQEIEDLRQKAEKVGELKAQKAAMQIPDMPEELTELPFRNLRK